MALQVGPSLSSLSSGRFVVRQPINLNFLRASSFDLFSVNMLDSIRMLIKQKKKSFDRTAIFRWLFRVSHSSPVKVISVVAF